LNRPEEEVHNREELVTVLGELRTVDASSRRRIYCLQIAEADGWQVADAFLEVTVGNGDGAALAKAKELVAKRKAKERSASKKRSPRSPDRGSRSPSPSPRRSSPAKRAR